MHRLYSKLQFVVLIITFIWCNVKVFLDFMIKNMKQKLFLRYQFVKSVEIRVLVLVYVTLWNYESFIFLFTFSQHFYVISKYRIQGGTCRETLWSVNTNCNIIKQKNNTKMVNRIKDYKHKHRAYEMWFSAIFRERGRKSYFIRPQKLGYNQTAAR